MLHHFMEDGCGGVVHLIKLINAADSIVTQNKSSTEMHTQPNIITKTYHHSNSFILNTSSYQLIESPSALTVGGRAV